MPIACPTRQAQEGEDFVASPESGFPQQKTVGVEGNLGKALIPHTQMDWKAHFPMFSREQYIFKKHSHVSKSELCLDGIAMVESIMRDKIAGELRGQGINAKSNPGALLKLKPYAHAHYLHITSAHETTTRIQADEQLWSLLESCRQIPWCVDYLRFCTQAKQETHRPK